VSDEPLDDWRVKHLAYYCAPFEIPTDPELEGAFTPEELDFLRRWGAWMLALANRQLSAETPEQEHFVAAANKKRLPETWAELLWDRNVCNRYWANLLPEEVAEIEASMEEYDKQVCEEAAAEEAYEKWCEEQEAEGYFDVDREDDDPEEGSPFGIDDFVNDDEQVDEHELDDDVQSSEDDEDADDEMEEELDSVDDGEWTSDEDDSY